MLETRERRIDLAAQGSRDALALVAELSQALASTLNLDATLNLAIARIADALEAEAASVFMIDRDGVALRCRAAVGPVDIVGLSLPLDEGVIGRTFATRQCQIVQDTRLDPDFTGAIDAVTGYRTRTMISTPLLTAQGPIGVIQAINKRADALFDHEDRDLLRALASPLALAAANAYLARILVEQTRLKRELELARRMQRSLLPKRRRGGDFPILALHRPAREISGDFYEYFDLADGRIAFAMGDVAGKGLDAAFLMVRCASLLRWTGKEGLRPSAWLARVNRELCETAEHGTFVCALVGYIDRQAKTAVWANAGLPSVLVQQGDTVAAFRAEAPPLGILPEMDFPEQTASLADASMYVFSDGLVEARDGNGRFLGIDGVIALIRAEAHWRPEARLRRIASALRPMKLADDTTLMLIEGR